MHTAPVLAKSLPRIGAPQSNALPRAPDTPIAGRYQCVIVIDEWKGGGISINAPGLQGHLPSANSWAAPYALVTQFHRR